jgi:hypothetical protein
MARFGDRDFPRPRKVAPPHPKDPKPDGRIPLPRKKTPEQRRADCRAKYPFHLRIQRSDDPGILSPDEFGHFVRWPDRDTTEWMFRTEEARRGFIAKYGGTKL